MAYLVEILIRNRPQIREKHDESSDEYNNLLVLERKIDDLTKSGILTDQELRILNLLSLGYSLGDLHLILKMDRDFVSAKVKKLTNKIAYYLGGEFTDAGYLEYMREKYKLSDEQVETLNLFINGKYYTRIARKTHEEPSK